MNQSLVSGITGAAPIWHDIMTQLLKERKPLWPEKPEGVVGKDVCVLTGLLPTPKTCDTRHEIFWEKFCRKTTGLRQRNLDPKDTGTPMDPAIPLDQQGELELQTHIVISDPLVPEFCLDCAYPMIQELNPDGTIKGERPNYPGSVINTTSLRGVRR